MNAHILLNLLNKLGKKDKMQGLRGRRMAIEIIS